MFFDWATTRSTGQVCPWNTIDTHAMCASTREYWAFAGRASPAAIRRRRSSKVRDVFGKRMLGTDGSDASVASFA